MQREQFMYCETDFKTRLIKVIMQPKVGFVTRLSRVSICEGFHCSLSDTVSGSKPIDQESKIKRKCISMNVDTALSSL